MGKIEEGGEGLGRDGGRGICHASSTTKRMKRQSEIDREKSGKHEDWNR